MSKIDSIRNSIFPRFGKLIVISPADNCKRASFVCRCDCGTIKTIRADRLLSKITRSCGCLRNGEQHGLSHTQEYRSWRHMKSRCYLQNDHNYHLYGGRGITICPEWINSFNQFYKDMGGVPTKKHTIERINSNGNYEPSNCCWATIKEQNRNKSNNHFITFKGCTQCITDWASQIGLSVNGFKKRINLNWSLDRIMTTPVNKAYQRLGRSRISHD